jgi:MFS family permease
MSIGFDSLHKVLKDKTRRKIMLLLHEKTSMSYTELMNALGITKTGMLNYHLKILGDLIAKNGEGHYILSQKGRITISLLTEFPDNGDARRLWQRRIWIILGIGQVAYVLAAFVLYYLGLVEPGRLLTATIGFIVAIVVLFLTYRMQRNIPEVGSNEEKSRMKMVYTFGGAWLAVIVTFVLGGLAIGLLSKFFHISFLSLFWSWEYLVFSLAIAPAIGATTGYYLGKKNKFVRPKWARWLETHVG